MDFVCLPMSFLITSQGYDCECHYCHFNIIIINGMIIKSPHDSLNYSNGFGRRGFGFELICWRLDVPHSCCISWLIKMKGVELVHISSNTLFEEVRAPDMWKICPVAR